MNPYWKARTGAPAAPRESQPKKEERVEDLPEPYRTVEMFLTQQEAEEEVEEEAAMARRAEQLVEKPSRSTSRRTSSKKNKKKDKKPKKKKRVVDPTAGHRREAKQGRPPRERRR